MQHNQANHIHKAMYVQSLDPGAVGAKIFWLDDSSGYILKKRNAANDGWDTIADLSAIGSGLTTEQVQDIVGAMATDSATIEFNYDDGAGTVTATVKDASIDAAKLAPASINAQTGTSYTLQASDNGKVVTCSNGSAITVTVPSGLGAGFNCLVVQIGAGQVTFSPSSTTLNNRQSHTKIAGQYGVASLVAYASNVFALGGDTTS